jgi:hypothetical protein
MLICRHAVLVTAFLLAFEKGKYNDNSFGTMLARDILSLGTLMNVQGTH